MLIFQDRIFSEARWRRREFLRVGGLALGGLTLGDLFAARARAAAKQLPLKDRSVIFLFMHGGPSQYETFDPKMDAPSTVRSATGEVKTTIPGVTFGATFQRLARLAHKFSIVRSLDRKSTRLNSSHITISYAVFCLKKKKKNSKLRSNLNIRIINVMLA